MRDAYSASRCTVPTRTKFDSFCIPFDDLFFGSVSFDQSHPRLVGVGVTNTNGALDNSASQNYFIFIGQLIKRTKKYVKNSPQFIGNLRRNSLISVHFTAHSNLLACGGRGACDRCMGFTSSYVGHLHIFTLFTLCPRLNNSP